MDGILYGELAALVCAIFWTFTALSFEFAGKRVGSLSVNFIRLLFGLVFLSLFNLVTRGFFLPLDAGRHQWIWLSVSGLIGFSLGDLFLFQAFVVVGARIAMLVMASVPLLTAILGRLFLQESLLPIDWLAMALTISGITLVVLKRNPDHQQNIFVHPVKGLLFAFGGALGQAAGLILSKIGMQSYNAFAATQIRVLAGIIGFIPIFFLLRRWGKLRVAINDRRAMTTIIIGSFFGPFLGVAFSLLAVQHAPAGIASTIMAIVPILIIPPAVFIFKEKLNITEIIGAIIAVCGVTLLFIF